MTHAVRGFGLAATLVFVSTLAVIPQAKAQSAYVYMQSQGPAGPVYGYSASSSGQLTAIPGSPFKPGTQIIGSNKAQFFTLGKTLIHSYAVGSNGAIGSQLSSIGFLNYSGSACGGGTNGFANGLLDHTGQYFYVELQNGGDGSCAAYQTYKINTGGTFTFIGDTEKNLVVGESDSVDLPSILGNESFGYASEWIGHYSSLIGFQRESSGMLQLIQFGETDPTLSGSVYLSANPDGAPSGNYAVVQLYPDNGGGDSNPPQLGSYTVDSKGNISSTNTQSNMPTTAVSPVGSSFSPDGSLFALNGEYGIEIYHFNGAAPLTLNTKLLNNTRVDQVAWDSSHHLYAYSSSTNKLYVFTVTSTSAIEDSSISVSSPWYMVVVSAAATTGGGCSAPASNGINVCSPANNATVTSPVQINAAATVSGGVYRFELWNGSTKLVSIDNSGIMDKSVSLAPGTYHLTFDAYNSAKTTHEYATRDITVK
ncbi:MAG TPA: Ig-like domain-containing protein [Terracidiphilus sp.]|jgi:hypothetical protein|nr:Ig-like domain-containing protein [Terracidiphilus sp.]